jgi:dTDP-4-dehydrorhamnose reductase
MGVITPHALVNPAITFFVNSAFPHLLSKTFKEKLIHITTICAFNGKRGFPYTEESIKTPEDMYDLSKSLGEPFNCLTLRSSMIGRELRGFYGLLEWFLQQEGKTINGFKDYIWNGITTKEFGNVCYKIIEERDKYPKSGIYHIFADSISKYEMLLKFKEKYNINCEIIPDDTVKINRTLSTIYPLNSQLKIPNFDEMLKVI